MSQILIVDDESEMTLVLQKFFARYGFSTRVCLRGDRALALLKTGKKFDIIILDMRMPGMRGITVLKQMEKLGIVIPVIVLTGSLNSTKFIETMESLGYSKEDVLFKPVNLKILLQLVKKKLKINMIKKK